MLVACYSYHANIWMNSRIEWIIYDTMQQQSFNCICKSKRKCISCTVFSKALSWRKQFNSKWNLIAMGGLQHDNSVIFLVSSNNKVPLESITYQYRRRALYPCQNIFTTCGFMLSAIIRPTCKKRFMGPRLTGHGLYRIRVVSRIFLFVMWDLHIYKSVTK